VLIFPTPLVAFQPLKPAPGGPPRPFPGTRASANRRRNPVFSFSGLVVVKLRAAGVNQAPPRFLWLRSGQVLRLRAISALSPDQPRKRSSQDDIFVESWRCRKQRLYRRYAAFFRLLTLRRSTALGDFAFACCARFPRSEICFLRAVSRETSTPPLRLAGFLRQLPSSCSPFPGTGSYPGQQREDLAYDLLFDGILFSSR
jgi:hypothetical protein